MLKLHNYTQRLAFIRIINDRIGRCVSIRNNHRKRTATTTANREYLHSRYAVLIFKLYNYLHVLTYNLTTNS